MWTREQTTEFPWLVTHKSHDAFRLKDPDVNETDTVLLLDGGHPVKYGPVCCSDCGVQLTMFGMLAGNWTIANRPYL